jgi:hypothetical protein
MASSTFRSANLLALLLISLFAQESCGLADTPPDQASAAINPQVAYENDEVRLTVTDTSAVDSLFVGGRWIMPDSVGPNFFIFHAPNIEGEYPISTSGAKGHTSYGKLRVRPRLRTPLSVNLKDYFIYRVGLYDVIRWSGSSELTKKFETEGSYAIEAVAIDSIYSSGVSCRFDWHEARLLNVHINVGESYRDSYHNLGYDHGIEFWCRAMDIEQRGDTLIAISRGHFALDSVIASSRGGYPNGQSWSSTYTHRPPYTSRQEARLYFLRK